MSEPVRVMLCDDSAMMRKLVTAALHADPSLLVIGEAKNGKEAVEKCLHLQPDVVIMDVEMPIMDGIQAVREIRKNGCRIPIIMFSSLTTAGGEATLDAMEAGANDFGTKPANKGHIDEALRHVRVQLIPKVQHWTAWSHQSDERRAEEQRRILDAETVRLTSPLPIPSKPDSTADTGASSPFVIGVGVSTGGPQALSRIVEGLPVDFPVPILVAQHMPPVFTGLLAERLASKRGHRVREERDGESIRAGDILIAPGDYHLTVTKDSMGEVRANLDKNPPENSCRPAADPLLRSIAECYGSNSLGLILTGMGKDGAKGARALRDAGASVFVQDEDSSVVWGMPGNVFREGLASRVLPIDQIASELIYLTKNKIASFV